jgi:hypothetical protein
MAGSKPRSGEVSGSRCWLVVGVDDPNARPSLEELLGLDPS